MIIIIARLHLSPHCLVSHHRRQSFAWQNKMYITHHIYIPSPRAHNPSRQVRRETFEILKKKKTRVHWIGSQRRTQTLALWPTAAGRVILCFTNDVYNVDELSHSPRTQSPPHCARARDTTNYHHHLRPWRPRRPRQLLIALPPSMLKYTKKIKPRQLKAHLYIYIYSASTPQPTQVCPLWCNLLKLPQSDMYVMKRRIIMKLTKKTQRKNPNRI